MHKRSTKRKSKDPLIKDLTIKKHSKNAFYQMRNIQIDIKKNSFMALPIDGDKVHF